MQPGRPGAPCGRPSHCLCHMPWETLLALLRWKEQVAWTGGVPGGLWRGSSHSSHFLSFPQGSPRGSPLQQPSLLLREMGFPEPPCTPLAWGGGGDAFLPCSGASEFLGELTPKGPIIQAVLPSPRHRTSRSSDDFAPGANLALFEMAPLDDQTAVPPITGRGFEGNPPPKKPLLKAGIKTGSHRSADGAKLRQQEPSSLAAFCLK